jgi:hypothetical protein
MSHAPSLRLLISFLVFLGDVPVPPVSPREWHLNVMLAPPPLVPVSWGQNFGKWLVLSYSASM